MSGTMNRRAFLGAMATAAAAAELLTIRRPGLGSGAVAAAAGVGVQPGTHTSFSSMKQIDAGVLNVGYAEAGPADGPPVLCLHGWPWATRTSCASKTISCSIPSPKRATSSSSI